MFIVSIDYKFCMEIFFSYLDKNFLKYFFFEDGIVIYCNVFFSSINDVGYILVFIFFNIFYEWKGFYVCCIEVFDDDVIYVS